MTPPARFPAVDGSQPCAGREIDEFFHQDGARGQVRQQLEADAKALCRQCPWVRECLAWALENENYGVWGATSEDERAALRQRHGLGAATAPEVRWRPQAGRDVQQLDDPSDIDDSEA